MSLFDSCFGSYSPATSVLKNFPSGLSQDREDAIVMAAQGGNVPYFNRHWVEVPVVGGGMTGTIFVTPDYFSIGTDEDFVRMPMAPATAEAIGSLIGGRLPTRKLVKDVHRAASQKLVAQPWGPPYDASMMSTGRFVAHNRKVQQQFFSKGFQLGPLTSGHKKDVVVSPRMDPAHVCIYGWFKNDSVDSAIQGPGPNCRDHVAKYADYSHGIRFVKDTMIAAGKEMLVDDVMRDPELYKLVSDEGVFKGPTRYTKQPGPKTEPPTGAVVTGLVFLALGFYGAQAVFV